jgi:hypothetical protein
MMLKIKNDSFCQFLNYFFPHGPWSLTSWGDNANIWQSCESHVGIVKQGGPFVPPFHSCKSILSSTKEGTFCPPISGSNVWSKRYPAYLLSKKICKGGCGAQKFLVSYPGRAWWLGCQGSSLFNNLSSLEWTYIATLLQQQERFIVIWMVWYHSCRR